jgi:hypothetical protein
MATTLRLAPADGPVATALPDSVLRRAVAIAIRPPDDAAVRVEHPVDPDDGARALLPSHAPTLLLISPSTSTG